MVSALAARWQLGPDLYRETGDTDIGVPPIAVRDHCLIDRLAELGYHQIRGNRFARSITDIPVRTLDRRDTAHQAIIDVLVPAYASRARQNRRINDQLVTTEVRGLATALQRPPVTMTLRLCRLNGQALDAELCFPDEAVALTLKAFAIRARTKPTDIVDLWRCLEIAFAAGIGPEHFTGGTPADATAVTRALFERRDAPGMTALAAEQRLSPAAADQRHTRLRALIARVLGLT